MTCGPLGVVWAGSAWRSPGAATASFALVGLDLDAASGQPRALDLPFFVHGIAPDPCRPERAALFEKHGGGAAIVDLATLAPVHTLPAAPGREFYGHGAFSRDGRLLYCTETDLAHDRRGYLGVFDTRDWARLGDLPTHGRAPHDCVLVDDGRVLVVGNGGGALGEPDPPCVTWIDLGSGTELARREHPDPRFDVGHLAIDARGDAVVVSAARFGTPEPTHARGGLALLARSGDGWVASGPAEAVEAMIGETLSVALHPGTGTIAATNPEGHQLSFWSVVDGSCRGRLRVPNPRGVALTLDGAAFVLSFGQHGKLVRIDAHTLQPVEAPGNREGLACGATGSHLLVHHVAPPA